MNDTERSEEWISRIVANNPCFKTAKDYRTCPVRLSFPHIFERGKPVEAGKTGVYGASLLFPKGADISLLRTAAAETAVAKWPKAGTPEGPKLKNPFLDQGASVKYGGFEEGAVYLRANAYENAPWVVDARQQIVTDPKLVYPGVWALAFINPGVYDKGVNKGVSFFLNGLMLIADDKELGSGSGRPTPMHFGGVQIDAEVNPAAGFGGQAEDKEAAARKALFG